MYDTKQKKMKMSASSNMSRSSRGLFAFLLLIFLLLAVVVVVVSTRAFVFQASSPMALRKDSMGRSLLLDQVQQKGHSNHHHNRTSSNNNSSRSSIPATPVNKMDASSCPSDWPDLELFLPITLRNNYWERFFFRSFFLFFPILESRVKLVMVYDEELAASSSTEVIADFMQKHKHRFHNASDFRLTYNPVLTFYGPGRHGNPGYDRQQYVMFYPEKYTNAKFVGFVDTDALFFTYVGLMDLFAINPKYQPGKAGFLGEKYIPIIHGRTGPDSGLWVGMTAGTFDILGLKEPMRCMSYFPQVYKVEHIIELRQFIAKRFNTTFDNAFQREFVPRFYSQFNLFCTYVFHFHRDEYQWYMHELKPNWDYQTPPSWPGLLDDVHAFTEEMKYPQPRIALHAKYRTKEEELLSNHLNYHDLLGIGICFSPPFPRKEAFCGLIQNLTNFLLQDYWKFELMDWNPVIPLEKRREVQQKRHEQIRHCKHKIDPALVPQPVFGIEEGDAIWTSMTGRALYYYHNGELQQIPSMDVYYQHHLKDSKAISNLLFTTLPKGPPLT